MVTKKCKHCDHNKWWRIGFNSKGEQRFRCAYCRKEFNAYEVLEIKGLDEVIEYTKTVAFHNETRQESINSITKIIINTNANLVEDTEVVEDLDNVIVDTSTDSIILNTLGRLSKESEILTKKEHLTFNIVLKLIEKHNLDALLNGTFAKIVDSSIKMTDVFLDKIKV